MKGRRGKKAGEELQWGLRRVGTYPMRSQKSWYLPDEESECGITF